MKPEKAKAPSERTYGQRYTKGVAVYDLIKDEADFDPQSNPLITKAALKAFLDSVGLANQQVADLTPAYNDAQDARVELYHGAEGLVKRVGTIRDVLGGYQNGKKSTAFLTVQRVAQEMRSYKQPKTKEVATGAEEGAGPSQAQTSFGSLLLKGREVLGVIKHMGADYKTSNALVKAAAFEAFLDDLEAQNTVISDALNPLNRAVRQRNQLVEGPQGLRERITAVKSYVAGEKSKGSTLHKELLKVRYS